MKEFTNQLLTQNVGVDVSKNTLDVVFSVMDIEQRVKIKASAKFANTPSGFKKFQKWIESKKAKGTGLRILMEATGIYYEQLAWFLYEKDYSVSVVLPTKAKRYLQALGNKSKNDKIDARGLAQMGLEQRLPLWQPVTKNIYRLRLLTRQLEDFNKQRTVLISQLHALHHSAYPVKEVEKNLKKMIGHLEKAIDQITDTIEVLIKEDPVLSSKAEKLLTIKGVGIKTIAVLIAETNGFATFENQGQLVSYSGYDIIEAQSGLRVGNTRMSKKGNAHIRRAMHMPALGVVRFRVKPFKSLHERLLSKGKTKMQAYVAVQRKLLIVLWTLWRKEEAFDPEFRQIHTSGNHETKPSFSQKRGGTGKVQQKQASPSDLPAQDELPSKQSTEALFQPVLCS
ncbi:IS110 family transposase [Owenweeksia hongkongensis]|uniref:IS110 family transposase n=1 Tax=Owenweeksia hongkongensis TaxID=253245 RepID=UPI003A8CCD68